jgi:hypothetical protein
MKTIFLSILATLSLAAIPCARAQADSQEKPKETPAQSSAEKPKPSQEELEAKFKTALTKATMAGRWCLIKNGELGPEKEDKYTINSIAKVGGDVWLINARIQYGKKDIVAPIPVQVKWAGDTPVIIVDKVAVPGGGTYSARVLIYEKTYAGTWTGGDHVGLLSGAIMPQKD